MSDPIPTPKSSVLMEFKPERFIPGLAAGLVSGIIDFNRGDIFSSAYI